MPNGPEPPSPESIPSDIDQRSATPPISSPSPPKRVRVAGSSPIDVPASDRFQKTLHFVVVGELTAGQADYIRIWAINNPDYTVKVWRDRSSETDYLRFKANIDFIYEFGDVDRLSYRRLSMLIWGLLDKKVLTDAKIPSSELKTIEEQQKANYARLERLPEGIPVIRVESIPDFLATLPDDSLVRTVYDQSAHIYNDPRLAERVIRDRILFAEGGLSLDRKSLPQRRRECFSLQKRYSG